MASFTVNSTALKATIGTQLKQTKRTQNFARNNRLVCKAVEEKNTVTEEAAPVESSVKMVEEEPKPAVKEETGLMTSVLNVFKSAEASETLNGRVAMVGFAAALANELSSGSTLLSQSTSTVPVLVAVVLMASLVPQFRGRKDNGLTTPAEPFAFFTPAKETINGRAAMMGLFALTVAENISGSAFF